MSISLTIDLSDRDLEHFNKAMEASRKAAEGKTPEEVVTAAGSLLADAQKVHVPDFVRERLLQLDDMIAMVRDKGWDMQDEDRQRVMSALVYFVDPKDVIPDNVEVLGFLDDAIMIELCVRELQHEIEAYEDFIAYRSDEASRRGVDVATLKTERVEWAEARRVELIDRMRKRRGQSYQSSGGWKPTLFSFRG